MGSVFGDDMRPFPPVGAKIRLNYGRGHLKTWKHWAEVVAIVDTDVMVILRVKPVNYWFYEMIDRIHWDVFQDNGRYEVQIPEEVRRG